MAPVLGKRKRRGEFENRRSHSPAGSDVSNTASEDLQDAFKRAFEAKFKPLDGLGQRRVKETSTEEPDDGGDGHSTASDWEGFDAEDEDGGSGDIVEVMDHGVAHKHDSLSKAEARAFMNSRPPVSISKPRQARPTGPEGAADEDDEKLNLKNDLALQRLINESHLLDTAKDDTNSFTQRQKLIDMRFQSLGSKSSMLQQDKMPLSHRKGIVAKANEREERRRREARENGIILEKVARPKKASSEDKRLRGVGGPSVGRFKNGTLKLSRKDVAEIKGPARRSRGTKSGKRR